LYFVSKDKYILTFVVNNSKAPYTDSFYLRGKKVVEKVAESKNIYNSRYYQCQKLFEDRFHEEGDGSKDHLIKDV
jgi:hypothetical protein